jgi:hypothetical protein
MTFEKPTLAQHIVLSDTHEFTVGYAEVFESENMGTVEAKLVNGDITIWSDTYMFA